MFLELILIVETFISAHIVRNIEFEFESLSSLNKGLPISPLVSEKVRS